MTYSGPYASFSEGHHHCGGSHIKRENSASPLDRVYETSPLGIQPLTFCSYNHTNDSLLQQQRSEKRFDYDNVDHPWSVEYLSTNSSGPLASSPLDSIFGLQAFQLLSANEQGELARLLPCENNNSTNTSNNLHGQEPTQHHFAQPPIFPKDENPVFWEPLHDWQSMLSNADISSDNNSSSTHSSHTTTATATAAHHPFFPLASCTTTITSANNANPHISSSSILSCNSGKNINIHTQHSNLSEMNPMLGVSFQDEALDPYWGDREKMHNVAGDSKNITLKDMCRKGLIRERDIIVYKRNFSACKVVVSRSMRVVKANGTTGISIELGNEIYEDFETPTALETKILDRHGKITKDKRPNGNAFKSIRLIREGKDLGRLFDIRKDCFGGAN